MVQIGGKSSPDGTMRSMAEHEDQQHQQIPRIRGALSFVGWAQVTGTLIALILVGAVLRLIAPYFGWWAPFITDALAIVFITCIFGAPIALVLHLWHKNRRENFRSRLVLPTQENAYPAYWDGATFQQPTPLPPPQKVPTHLNFAPTVQQRNDTELIRLLREIVYNRTTCVKPEQQPELDVPALPSYVEYEHIRHLIPRGHALVGVSGSGIETKDEYVRALLWIVGGSGSGKTNSTVIRVDDDVRRGHQFLGVDPHATKPDSLTNALSGYASLFRIPIAESLEDIEVVLDAFLEEFYGRRDSGWELSPPITLVVDEVDTLTVGIDKSDAVAVRVSEKLKRISRICGQESRDYGLLSIVISHNAAGLAWLRRDAVMVLAHQVVQFSERLLVCNQDREIARMMDNWPKGRTYVYGIAFEDGPLLVQQPVVKTRVIDATVRMQDLPRKTDRKLSEDPARYRQKAQNLSEDSRETTGRESCEVFSTSGELKNMLKEAGRLRDNGESIDSILKKLGLSPGGRNNQSLKMLLDGMAAQD